MKRDMKQILKKNLMKRCHDADGTTITKSGNTDEPTEGKEAETGTKIGTAWSKTKGKKIAERFVASDLQRLPTNKINVIIRPKEGLATIKNAALAKTTDAILRAAGLTTMDCSYVSDKLVTIIYFSPNFERGDKVSEIKSVKIEDKLHKVTAYMLAPEDSGRGVVHGVDPCMKESEILEGFTRHVKNPQILGVRRMGKTQTVTITFEKETVLCRLIFYSGFMKCFLFKKHYKVCYWCGELGHRSDVRSS